MIRLSQNVSVYGYYWQFGVFFKEINKSKDWRLILQAEIKGIRESLENKGIKY